MAYNHDIDKPRQPANNGTITNYDAWSNGTVGVLTASAERKITVWQNRGFNYTVSQKNIPDIFDCNLKTN